MIDRSPSTDRAQTLLLLVGAWCLMLVVHGAVPFLLTPTLGQAVWSTGFSQSFANQSPWAIHATNFGAPEPAAMAFGLPGAWTTALYIQLGLQPPDAYSAMVASWMTLAWFSAYALARHYWVKRPLATLAALGWMSMPVTWAHAGFSMLSIGIALLPLYLLSAIKLLEASAPLEGEEAIRSHIYRGVFPLICTLAVFMDGYSFMFFAVGASLLAVWWWLRIDTEGRKKLALVALPLLLISFLVAYLLYAAFIGKSGYPPTASLDFFRGAGADLTFFAKPTLGIHWLPDALGWSVTRSTNEHFGSTYVWSTTFSIPVVLGGVWAAWRIKPAQKVALGFLLIALFGFYMALGPSIKLNSVRPEGGVSMDYWMPAEAAIAPTGSGFLSEKLPGFNNMRASYRWTALGVLGAWGLLVLSLSARHGRGTRLIGASLMGVVILFNLPDLPDKWTKDAKSRAMFFQIETDLVDDMRGVLREGDRVAFLPWRNDFLVNYLAARLNIVSYNIGGDKNLESAREHWPTTMRGFVMGQTDPRFATRVALVLATREADAVVLPYIDMLWAAHKWPAINAFKTELEPSITFLQDTSLFEITRSAHYTTVRLKQAHLNWPTSTLVGKVLLASCTTSSCEKSAKIDNDSFAKHAFLMEGWSVPEPWGQWSDGESASVLLNIATPPHGDLELLVNGHAFLVPEKHPEQHVEIFLNDRKIGQWDYALPGDAEPSVKSVTIPRDSWIDSMEKMEPWLLLTFRFKKPQSPADLGISMDSRRISLGLTSLSLREKSASVPTR